MYYNHKWLHSFFLKPSIMYYFTKQVEKISGYFNRLFLASKITPTVKFVFPLSPKFAWAKPHSVVYDT